jgi:hypothetical protein
MIAYLSLVVAMKVAAVRYGWDVGAVCGAWVVLLAVSFGVCGWLAVAFGWRAALAGLVTGFVWSLVASALILGRG